MSIQRLLARVAAAALLSLSAIAPASAAVTITFWSHELGNMFPHAFITMRGAPDAGGAPVDLNIGFTAKHISPAILFGTVGGMLEPADLNYLKSSDAHFSMVLTDAQYQDMLKLIEEWGPTGDQHYNMNKRNCVTFTQVAAQRLGLAGTDQPKLMKRPRSFMNAVEAANVGRVTVIDQHGAAYIASLQPVPGVDASKPVLTATGPVPSALAFTATSAAPAPTAVITTQSMQTGGAKDPADSAKGAKAPSDAPGGPPAVH